MDRRLTMRGADRAYVLLPDTNAQCRIEAATSLSYPMVIEAIRGGNMTVLRAWVHGALIDPLGQTLEQVGAIVDDIGGLEVFAAGMRGAKKQRGRRG